ncbi:hypothetical protein B9Z19DRAFT_1130392 [Tuber borchii]|uniref:Uncharacterized protein n=1 Tax=Tuber borchii TaxID=42251 RepID=A0A2T6ZKP7_TUBBO|nr:hypothetical protein B9Z19DRAFT_1130392 [Tuber borchii]
MLSTLVARTKGNETFLLAVGSFVSSWAAMAYTKQTHIAQGFRIRDEQIRKTYTSQINCTEHGQSPAQK